MKITLADFITLEPPIKLFISLLDMNGVEDLSSLDLMVVVRKKTAHLLNNMHNRGRLDTLQDEDGDPINLYFADVDFLPFKDEAWVKENIYKPKEKEEPKEYWMISYQKLAPLDKTETASGVIDIHPMIWLRRVSEAAGYTYSLLLAHPISQALFDRMSDGRMNLSNLWK